MKNVIRELIQQHRLPENFSSTVEQWYQPIAHDIAALAPYSGAKVIGVQGCQGSGKSTFSDFLRCLLKEDHGLNAAVLSIDDFYLTKAEREALALSVHPLLKTRGVPGTHDVDLALNTIETLKSLGDNTQCPIPRFNKAIDDRYPEAEWDSATGPIHCIILEGWCVGLTPQDEEALLPHINELEQNEDAEGLWRRYVNTCLAKKYQTLFSMIDHTVMLAPPSFRCVFEWRLLQEEKLKEKLAALGNPTASDGIMNPEQIRRFISHYQRLTEHALTSMPKRVDWLLTLGDDHSITGLHKASTAVPHQGSPA